MLRVAIASIHENAGAAAVIALALNAPRFDVVALDEPHDIAIVLLSSASVLDEGFLASVLAHQMPVVPVALDVAAASSVPAALASLNWIWWDAEKPQAAAAALATALTTDPHTYAAFRALEAKATAWTNAGRSDDELLGSLAQVLRAQAASDAEAGRRDADSPILAFLEASYAHARSIRRRRLRNAIFTVAVAALAIIAIVGLVRDVRTVRVRTSLALVANADLPIAAADLNSVKIAAFMLLSESDSDDLTGSPASANLAAMLSQPWAVARYTAPDSSAVNGLAVYDHGTKAWLARGDGALESISLDGTHLDSARAEGSLYAVASSADGSVVLGSGAESVTIFGSGQVVGIHPLSEVADELAVSADGRHGAVVIGDRIETLDLASDSIRKVEETRWDDVLDIGVADEGAIVALVRLGARLKVLDVVSGDVLWRASAPGPQLLTGAVGADGSVVLSAQRRLWWSDGTAALASTGIPTADVSTALATDRGVVAVSTDVAGTRVYDMSLGIPLPDTCGSLGSVRGVILIPDRDAIMCDATGTFELWQLDRPTPPDLPPIANAAVSAPLDRLPAGVVLNDEVTASTTTAQTVIIGTAGGEIVEFDLPDEGRGILTGRWTLSDGRPVTSLAYLEDGLVARTDAATWTLRTCPGCGLDVDRQIAAVAERHKRCFEPSLGDLVPEDVLEDLRVTLCRDTV